jgi:hypothetical protein
MRNAERDETIRAAAASPHPKYIRALPMVSAAEGANSGTVSTTIRVCGSRHYIIGFDSSEVIKT